MQYVLTPRSSRLYPLLCLLLLTLPAAAQTGTITGKVLDASGAAIPNAAVRLIGPGDAAIAEATAAADGGFRIEAVEPGSYELAAASPGMAETRQGVRVSVGGTAETTIFLRPSGISQQVEVTATVDAVSGAVTKMDIPLLETPQAIAIIPREQLEEQKPLRLQDAMRYSAGVATGLYGQDARGDWMSMRGAEDSGQYLNGLRMLFNYYNNVRPEPFALERIEVMRGPSSVLFGQSGFGGVINLVSKRPLQQHHREIEVQLGSYRRRQVGFDVTGPMGDSRHWFYRFVGVARDSNTQVDYVPEDRLLLAPSLTWRPRSTTSLTFLTNFQKDETGSSVGFFPWQGTLLPSAFGRIPTNTFISEPGFDEYNSEQIALGYLFAHSFSNGWTIRQNANYTESSVSYQSLYTAFNPRPTFLEDNRSVERNIYVSKPKIHSPVIDTQAEKRLRTGSVQHTFLAGTGYQGAVQNEVWGYDLAPAIDVYAPQYGNYTVPTLYPNPESRQSQVGVYGQDHLKLTERLSTTLGVRKDWARSKNEGDPDSLNKDGAVTGRAGVVYAAGGGLAPYFSFSQSFQPLAGTDIYNKPYKPTRARQFEAGAKYQPGASQTLLTTSVFDIRENNRLTPDLSNPLNNLQAGEAHIRGFEFESRSKPFWDVNLIANYTFLDARISESNDDTQGKRIPVTPKHNASVWALKNFELPDVPGVFGAGGGVRHIGATFDGLDALRVPAYTVFDLTASYQRQSWRLAVNAANLTNKTYVAACLARGDCFFGVQRMVTGSISYRF
ncbi:MAG: TonB-dependent siderophore receptor [Acidobacteria bacterium]|nr:TonB-dependent siderophore receptor [Acidobacteriota bacterium]